MIENFMLRNVLRAVKKKAPSQSHSQPFMREMNLLLQWQLRPYWRHSLQSLHQMLRYLAGRYLRLQITGKMRHFLRHIWNGSRG